MQQRLAIVARARQRPPGLADGRTIRRARHT
jgi:hypothetical protein